MINKFTEEIAVILPTYNGEEFIEKQIKNIFADKKLSKKLNEELINYAKPLTEEKRKFYKTIFKVWFF